MSTDYISNNFPYALLNMLGITYPMSGADATFTPQLTNYGIAPGQTYNPMYYDPRDGGYHSTLIGSVVFPGRESPLPGATIHEIPATWFPVLNAPGSDYYNGTYDLYHSINPRLPQNSLIFNNSRGNSSSGRVSTGNTGGAVSFLI